MRSLQKQQGSAHIIAIVVLIVAILGALGFVFWQNFNNKDDSVETVKTDSSDTTGNLQGSENNSLLKTYTNADLGFSVTYPSGWTLSTDQQDSRVATITSLETAAKRSTNPNQTQYDVDINYEPQSGPTGNSSLGTIMALKGNAAEFASMKYTETINSIDVTEYDMYAQTPYFAAIFPVGGNYVVLSFNAETKADMTATMTEILHSFKNI